MKMFFEGALDRAAKARHAVRIFKDPPPAGCDKQVKVMMDIQIWTDISHGDGAEPQRVHIPAEAIRRLENYLQRHIETGLALAVAELEADADTQLIAGRNTIQGYLDRINEIEAKRKTAESSNDA